MKMGDPAIKTIRDPFDKWEGDALHTRIEMAVAKAVAQATAGRDAKLTALEEQLSKMQELKNSHRTRPT